MEAIIYRTCEVKKWGETYSICKLQYVNNRYVVIVLVDSENLFVEFELDNNESTDIAIKFFEDECLNRFTCFGDFSFEEVKENSGEEILFY